MEQHGCPYADAIAVDRSDDRHLAFGEGAKKAPHGNLLTATGPHLQEIREVVAGREVLAFAADRDDARLSVLERSGNRVRERGVHCNRDGVAPFGAVERD